MNNNQFDRTIGLLGLDSFNEIQNKTIAIFGLGGVGGTCFEALLRTGFKHFLICDFDKVDETNLNRQILYTRNDIGLDKVICAKKRAESIVKDIDIQVLDTKLSAETIGILDNYSIDFIVDAIDDVPAKVTLAMYSNNKNIPIVMSLGMACRIEPEQVSITKLNKTTNDPLAKKLRYELKKQGANLSLISVAFSQESRKTEGVKLNSVIFPPSSAGLNIASFVVKYFLK